MDVFTQARAELSLLEDKERRLRKELLGVRTAITTQRAKITELLRTRAAAINHLPTEILLFIFDLDVHSNPYPGRNYELAAVCRRWRDVVLDSPSLWTTIHVADLKPSSIITHLERGRGAFLDIVIDSTDRGQAYHFAHVPSLQIVSSCADRWRNLSITIRGCIYYSDDGRVPRMECILRRINHLNFLLSLARNWFRILIFNIWISFLQVMHQFSNIWNSAIWPLIWPLRTLRTLVFRQSLH